MPKITSLQSNFTAGELTPKLYGRVDIERYQNGVKLARNGYAFVHGGWRWRMGLRFVAEIKNSVLPARLIPYVLDEDEAYLVELSEAYAGPVTSFARFYSGAGRVEVASVPVELHLTTGHSPVSKTKYAQDSGVLYLTNGNVFDNLFSNVSPIVETIERITPTAFATTPAAIFPRPSTEIEEIFPTVGLTLTALSGVITATAGLAVFQPADVGRFIRSGAGYAQITGFTSTTIVTIDTTQLGGRPFTSLLLTAGSWLIDSSPQTTLTPSAVGSIGTVITLTLSLAGWKDNAQYSHVGKYVEINGGFAEITVVTSTTVASGKVWALLTSATAAGPGGWVLRMGLAPIANTTLFNAITFHEQRMVLANSIGPIVGTNGTRAWAEPQTIFFSVSGLLEFSVGSADDDALELLAKSETVTPIQHLVSFGDLIAFSGTTVFKILGGLEKPITPTNFQIKAQNEDGANYVRPVKISNEALFVESSGKRVLALAYKAESDKYTAGDVSTLAEHILGIGVVDMAYARRPDPLLFCVLADGRLAVCAYDRDQNVIGWSLCETDGFFEAVGVISYQNVHIPHFIVRRTVGGVTKRYVERMEDGRETDSCVVGTAGAPATVWAGFGHLEGKTLDVIADGSYVGQKVVTGGSITIDTAATSIEAGLHYDGQLQLLRAEIAGQAGTNQADAVSVHEVRMRVRNSVGCKVRGKPIVFTTPTVFGSPPQTFSGDWPVGTLGTSNDEILIERDKPYPFTLLAVMRKVSINAG